MTVPSNDAQIARARAVARIRALRMGLLALHKALLDVEQRRYERVHGRIEGPHQALHLVLKDPWFAWVRPVSELIVEVDARLDDDDHPLQWSEAQAYRNQIAGLLQQDLGSETFREQYRRCLQDEPDVVMAHGKLVALLTTEE
jgi:hypothetical protein